MDVDAPTRTSSVDKGKGRADEPTERTPLLTGTSSSHESLDDVSSSAITPLRRRRLWTRLLIVFSVTLLVCIAVFLIFGLLAWSYASRASKLSPDQILHEGVVFKGPERVDVLNVTDASAISVEISGRAGINAGAVVGVQSDPYGDPFFKDIWKSFGRWWIRRLGKVNVELSTVDILSDDGSQVLASVDIPPTELDLNDDPPRDLSWLQNITEAVLLRPTSDVGLLMDVLREAWDQSALVVYASVASVDVKGGSLGESGWRRMLSRHLSDVKTRVQVQLPTIPGLPAPGPENPLPSIEDLVTLKSFGIYSHEDKLDLHAEATVLDPAPMDLNFTAPALAFVVSLPAQNSTPVPIASVSTRPFSLTHPNITLFISGHVLPFTQQATVLLSSFLTRYLSAELNTIAISTPLLPGIFVDAIFPPPNPKPHVLRNVTIHDMKIKPGNTFLTSGNVVARVVLPQGMHIGLDVKTILPDVLVFDGEVPEDVEVGTKPPVLPLPDPLPERAFGRIRPDDYLNATCEPDGEVEGEGSAFLVSAHIEDVPLEVLPGRQNEFSKFIGKVIFDSEGALAGIMGTTAVSATVDGLPLDDESEGMELSGLPFKGSVRIGKKNL